MICSVLDVKSIKLPDDIAKYEELEDMLLYITLDNMDSIVEFIVSNFHDEDLFQSYLYIAKYMSLYTLNIDLYMHIYRTLINKTKCNLTMYESIFKLPFDIFSANMETKERIATTRQDIFNKYIQETNTIAEAIFNDDVEELKSFLLIDTKKTLTRSFELHHLIKDRFTPITFAARFGSINCFKYMLLNGVEINQRTVENALIGGNLEIFHLCEKGIASPAYLFIKALNQQNKDLIYWIMMHYDIVITSSNTLESITSFNIRFIIYFINNTGYRREYDLVAINSDNLAVIKYISNNIKGKQVSISPNNCLHIVKYLVDKCEAIVDEKSLASIAINNDNAGLLKIGKEKLGFAYKETSIFKESVKSNSIACTKYLLDNGIIPTPVEYKSKEMRNLVNSYQEDSD